MLCVLLVDPTFADPEMYLGVELWTFYTVCLQIYYDFSAYTDIAIGRHYIWYSTSKTLIARIKTSAAI